MRARTWSVVGLIMAVGAVACGAPSDETESSEGAVEETAAFDPYEADTWQFKTGKPGCALGPIGENIEKAVRGARHNLDIMPNGKDDARWVTMRNAAGPAFLDGNEMFPAIRTLIS